MNLITDRHEQDAAILKAAIRSFGPAGVPPLVWVITRECCGEKRGQTFTHLGVAVCGGATSEQKLDVVAIRNNLGIDTFIEWRA